MSRRCVRQPVCFNMLIPATRSPENQIPEVMRFGLHDVPRFHTSLHVNYQTLVLHNKLRNGVFITVVNSDPTNGWKNRLWCGCSWAKCLDEQPHRRPSAHIGATYKGRHISDEYESLAVLRIPTHPMIIRRTNGLIRKWDQVALWLRAPAKSVDSSERGD